jgi:Na+(H+)/acetate symporter ActP
MPDQQLLLTVSLLLGSAIVGFLIGLRFRVIVIVLVALIIAATAAIILRDLHFFPAIAITVASLSVNQIAYLIGAWLRNGSINEQSDDDIGRDC